MVTYKVLLDTRRAKSDGTYSVQIRITYNRKSSTLNTGVFVKETFWDDAQAKVANTHPNAPLLNKRTTEFYLKVQKAVLELEGEDNFEFDALKERLSDNYITPKTKRNREFKEFADQLIAGMYAANETGNATVYQTATNRLMAFANNPKVRFVDINYTFLESFKRHLTKQGIKPNSVSNYFRTLRAIYNKAIKAKLVDRSHYPFLDVTVKTEKTAKRAITLEDLRRILYEPYKLKSQEWHARSYFLLSFALRGASFTDLAYLKPSNIDKHMLAYKRRKTGTELKIKVIPEVTKLLSYYASSNSKYLLPILPYDIIEGSREAKKLIAQWIKTTNKYLDRIGIKLGIDDEITTYVSRHTWATSAKKLGFSNELIAECLGHEYGNKITNIYLDTFDQSIIDKVNSVVLLNLKSCQREDKHLHRYGLNSMFNDPSFKGQKLKLQPEAVL
ncbi:site-specific integrase [Mucilaginibacter sp. FT3.2]|uniref:site-specific integrase n=1 Tax=Mucilaginibacter sp. FT3.2 TaxID=2723090 RepID=UPI00160FDFB7|nr:site-specific integrase [Mucilaginibacter sp. FT3.2]MBB6232548.1 integrase [Mucilaginibacter sp. FT3.2]